MPQQDNESLDIQLARWSEALSSIARTGLAFTQNLYERERYEEVLHVAADIKAVLEEAVESQRERNHYMQEWMDNIGEGIPGYITPKVAIDWSNCRKRRRRDLARKARAEWGMALSIGLG
jgi:hypothetical protein